MEKKFTQEKILAKEADIEGFDPNKGVTLANATEQVKAFQRKKAKEMREKGVAYTQAFKTRQSFGAASKGRSLSEEEVKKYIASLEEK